MEEQIVLVHGKLARLRFADSVRLRNLGRGAVQVCSKSDLLGSTHEYEGERQAIDETRGIVFVVGQIDGWQLSCCGCRDQSSGV